ncbi:MAG: hypothetical protein ABIX01_21995 [Chitinophagaceae bacterium]
MKPVIKFSAILAITSFSILANAQRLKVTDGDLAFLKDETMVNVEFTYDNMSVGKFDKEQDYLDKKKAEYNTKEPGRGDTWVKSWISDRKREFEPMFIDLFEKTSGMTVSSKAKYTIIFHTTSTEPGYNIYISKKNAEIDAEVTIVETADRSKKLAVISISNAPGRTFSGNDYATGDRIKECYAVSGKRLAKLIKK